ncbi:Bug family tripartite tricarboxylate transporter substrate binding protein [Polaromonas sp.]|uniref:Bug family tripartite tricarboxylate transporter substrate binding protein n=1 Tax=Polaromonas sp. TaxID=1869339 RepID=UPI003BAB2F02
MQSLFRYTLLAITLIAQSLSAGAADYPSQPIKIIVNSAPGGPTDILGRLIAVRLGASLGQPVIVDNRAGAGGNIGVDAVAKARPDGYTLLLAVDNVFTVNPLIYTKLPFDIDKDLRPVAQTGETQMVLVVNPRTKVRNLAEFVELTKTKNVNYSSAGNGSPGHLTFEYFAHELGLKAQHVPYKGNAPAIQALLAGEVDAGFLGVSGALPGIKAGKLTAIAVGSARPLASLPQVPTIKSLGFPNFEVTIGFYLMAPRGTPDAVVAQLSDGIEAAFKAPDLRAQLSAMLIDPVVKNSGAAKAQILADRAKWKKVVDSAKVTVE